MPAERSFRWSGVEELPESRDALPIAGGERFLEGGAPLRRSVEALAAAERDGLRPFEADVPGAAHTVAAERLRQPPGQARPPASR